MKIIESFLKKFGLHIDKKDLEIKDVINIYNEDFDILGCYNKNDDSIIAFIENGCLSAKKSDDDKKVSFTIAKQYSNELLEGYLDDSNLLHYDAFELGYRKKTKKYVYVYFPSNRSFMLKDDIKNIFLSKQGNEIVCIDDISSSKIEMNDNLIIYSKSSKDDNDQIFGIVDLENKNMNEELNNIMNIINEEAVEMFCSAKDFIAGFQDGLENKLFATDLNFSKIKEKGKKSRIKKKNEKRK